MLLEIIFITLACIYCCRYDVRLKILPTICLAINSYNTNLSMYFPLFFYTFGDFFMFYKEDPFYFNIAILSFLSGHAIMLDEKLCYIVITYSFIFLPIFKYISNHVSNTHLKQLTRVNLILYAIFFVYLLLNCDQTVKLGYLIFAISDIVVLLRMFKVIDIHYGYSMSLYWLGLYLASVK